MPTRRSTTKAPPHPWMAVPVPTSRHLQVFAYDPSVGGYRDNRTTLEIPWEPLGPGPTGAKIAVVDYDAANDCFYAPVDLDDPMLLARHGIDPSESDPRFHQQMVYAVASRTIQMFEVALGRTVHWRRADRYADPDGQDARFRKRGDIRVLNLYPHAIHDANAFYSPEASGILFGYFTADAANPGRNLPGQRVFTCLSHDIVAHEVTHAIIDGIRAYFTEPTNPDVLAFHEGFADLCALFSHFAVPEAIVDTIRRTGGRLYETTLGTDAPASDDPAISAQIRQANPLVGLAQQFGQASGAGRALRSALGTPPNADDINRRVDDPHFRGSILVSAVFDAYFSVYLRRADDLLRLAGVGDRRTNEIPELLAEHLARIASDTAHFFFRLCARALDFCPPIDVTFGDFLRAVITVAGDLRPDDEDDVRDALMESFRLRGIYADDAGFYSLDALRWPPVPAGSIPAVGPVTITHPTTGEQVEAGLVFAGPAGQTSEERDINGRVLRAWVNDHRDELGLDPDLPVGVPSFHQVFRELPNGRIHVELVVEVLQSTSRDIHPDGDVLGSFPFRGGATLVIDGPVLAHDGHGRRVRTAPELRFVIGKSITGQEGERRLANQRAFALSQGIPVGTGRHEHQFQADFARLHQER